MEAAQAEPTPNMLTPGPWVGHYTTAALAFEKIIPTGELRMSPYRRMRDPFENKLIVPGGGYAGKPSPNPEADWLAAVQLVSETRERVRLLSFTQDVLDYEGQALKFGCCWARARTWEQYADAHRGVCLVFERAALRSALSADFGDRVAFGPVGYTPERIEVAPLMDPRIFDGETREAAVLDYIKQNRETLFFLKTDDWRSEHEFRAVLFEVADEFAVAKYGDALRAVVIGEKFPGWQVTGAETLAAEHGLELKQAHWAQGLPWLTSAT